VSKEVKEAKEGRRKFTKEFKQQACRLVVDQGQKRSETATRNLGVSESVLGRWVRQYKAYGVVSFPGSGRMLPLEEELRRTQRELARVKMEREILKKAITFFRENEK
jgi:transposase